jgi:hypothetical protein
VDSVQVPLGIVVIFPRHIQCQVHFLCTLIDSVQR